MKAANSAGVLPTAIAASPCSRSSAAGSRTARAAAAASLSVAGAARLAGARMPYHCVISKPGQPCSATVPTSGSWAIRWLDPVAMQRSLPALMNCSTAGAPTAAACKRPASRSVSCGPVPRYGTCSTKMPVVVFRYSNARWPALPLPADP